MKDRYLEVTFRKGRALAAYLYLPRDSGAKSARTEKAEKGIVIDFDKDGKVIGLELTAPALVSVDDVNQVLRRLGQPPIDSGELAPLAA